MFYRVYILNKINNDWIPCGVLIAKNVKVAIQQSKKINPGERVLILPIN